jgi:pimeloyl-ACP methyl ester carboxylesterase
MQKQKDTDPQQFIRPLTINSLHGRVLHKPAAEHAVSEREILFVYGQHSSIERWWGMIQELSLYGSVTVPDLPGYGGMDSLYTIGRKPTFEELGDYLADFIHDYYPPDTSLSVVGLSIGFAVVTRMLERHPELTNRVSLLVSVVGFAHHDDFVFSKSRQAFYVYGSRFFSIRPLDKVLQHVIFNPAILRRAYHRSFNAKEKFARLSGDEFNRTMAMEIELWKINDIRTWMRSNIEMFQLDNCIAKVPIPVLHLSVRKDRYFSLEQVETHYRQIFSGYEHIQLAADSHGPSVIATPEEASILIPPKLREMLVDPNRK